mmetsp:Transcript_38432/g.107053  ORF Transcript_38432/g.107053 Transcript_38432/m.107053 type:complete len:298 (-) Transcript_38432:59-952(-)
MADSCTEEGVAEQRAEEPAAAVKQSTEDACPKGEGGGGAPLEGAEAKATEAKAAEGAEAGAEGGEEAAAAEGAAAEAKEGAEAEPEDAVEAKEGAEAEAKERAEAEEPTCWICLGGAGEEDDPLIEPCNCRGGQRLCHRKCITDWLKTRMQPGQAATSMESLRCHICGERYSVRAKPLWQLSWKQWRSLFVPACGMLFAMVMVGIKVYARFARFRAKQEFIEAVNKVPAPGGGTAGFGLPYDSSFMTWGGSTMVTIYAVMSILRLGTRVYTIAGKFVNEMRSVQAETLTVEGHSHQD